MTYPIHLRGEKDMNVEFMVLVDTYETLNKENPNMSSADKTRIAWRRYEKIENLVDKL